MKKEQIAKIVKKSHVIQEDLFFVEVSGAYLPKDKCTSSRFAVINFSIDAVDEKAQAAPCAWQCDSPGDPRTEIKIRTDRHDAVEHNRVPVEVGKFEKRIQDGIKAVKNEWMKKIFPRWQEVGGNEVYFKEVEFLHGGGNYLLLRLKLHGRVTHGIEGDREHYFEGIVRLTFAYEDRAIVTARVVENFYSIAPLDEKLALLSEDEKEDMWLQLYYYIIAYQHDDIRKIPKELYRMWIDRQW